MTRLFFVAVGAAAIGWAVAAIPAFRAETAPVAVANAVQAGEPYRPETLEAVDASAARDGKSALRSAVQGRVALIRLRRLEQAMRSDDTARIDSLLASFGSSLDQALSNTPQDSLMWLVKFWLEATRTGLVPEHFEHLRMSYALGPREGWVAFKRNPVVMAVYPALPADLADKAAVEFIDFVRAGFYAQAAEIVKGPARGLRGTLYPRLTEVSLAGRRSFARVLAERDLHDVPVPGIDPQPSRPWRR